MSWKQEVQKEFMAYPDDGTRIAATEDVGGKSGIVLAPLSVAARWT